MYDKYARYIDTFIDSDVETWEFKSHPDYRYMLEHVTEEQGIAYLIAIKEKYNAIYNKNKKLFKDICHENDLYGSPKKYNFDDFICCSPTNARYIFHSLLILSYMKECMLNNIDIIEIGGGYGGLCFFMYKLANIFNITINTYAIFDLPNPLMLQKKYLEKLNIHDVNYLELDSIKKLKKNSFLISNYAFSEISFDLRQKYSISVLNPYTSHGFLAWNIIPVYPFLDNKNILIENEYPMTSVMNKYVYFKPNNCNPVPDLYIRDVSKCKKDTIETITNNWHVKYKQHFSPNNAPNKPNINRDRFIDLLEMIYDKYKITEETKMLLEQKLEIANTSISYNKPKNITKNILDKCSATGCWLFIYSTHELVKMI
jgi:hypothetical protein